MPISTLILLILLFFVTSAVGVVTGGNSLITVPVMFAMGIDEKTAIATNMFGLTFMAIGGAIPFLRQGKVDVKKLSPMIVLTIVGSAIGAAIVGLITNEAIKVIVTVAMIGVVVFILLSGNGRSNPDNGSDVVHRSAPPKNPSGYAGGSALLGYGLAFALAIYGGLYSGGYVTVLTAVLIAF